MIYLAETERLFRRTTAIFGLAVAAFFGLLGPGLIFFGNTMAVSFGTSLGSRSLPSPWPAGTMPCTPVLAREVR